MNDIVCMLAAVTHFIVCQTQFLSMYAAVALSCLEPVQNDHWRRRRWKPGSRIVESSAKEEFIAVAECQSSCHRPHTSTVNRSPCHQ